MPCDYKEYHPNWKYIRAWILNRARNRCELCNAENYKPHWKTGSKVVLTVHHKNFDIKDNRKVNLIALCQRCHLILDMPNRYKKRTRKKLYQECSLCGKKKLHKEFNAIDILGCKALDRRCNECLEKLKSANK